MKMFQSNYKLVTQHHASAQTNIRLATSLSLLLIYQSLLYPLFHLLLFYRPPPVSSSFFTMLFGKIVLSIGVHSKHNSYMTTH